MVLWYYYQSKVRLIATVAGIGKATWGKRRGSLWMIWTCQYEPNGRQCVALLCQPFSFSSVFLSFVVWTAPKRRSINESSVFIWAQQVPSCYISGRSWRCLNEAGGRKKNTFWSVSEIKYSHRHFCTGSSALPACNGGGGIFFFALPISRLIFLFFFFPLSFLFPL